MTAAEMFCFLQGDFGTRQSLCDVSLKGQLWVQPEAHPFCHSLFSGKLLFSIRMTTCSVARSNLRHLLKSKTFVLLMSNSASLSHHESSACRATLSSVSISLVNSPHLNAKPMSSTECTSLTFPSRLESYGETGKDKPRQAVLNRSLLGRGTPEHQSGSNRMIDHRCILLSVPGAFRYINSCTASDVRMISYHRRD